MNEPSTVHAELERLLADGQWHDYHEILGKAALVVQPGAAIRACERNRQLSSKSDTRKKQLSTSEQVRLGARQIVQAVMLNKAFQIDPPGPLKAYTRKQIRLAPLSSYMRAPSRQSPQLRLAFELLADGEWHDIEPVLKAMVDVVPREKWPTRPGNDPASLMRAKVWNQLAANPALEIDRTSSPRRVRVKPRTT